MNAWLSQHKYALGQVLSRFGRNKLGTLLICVAIGVTLALPSTLYQVLSSLNGLVSGVKKESHLSVFLDTSAEEATIQTVKNELESNSAVKSFEFISKEDALNALLASDANQQVLSSLENNPLPDAFLVAPASLEPDAVEALKTELAAIDGVEEVQVDDAWIKRLNYLLRLGKNAMIVLAGLLGLALVAVIGNTIRMQIVTQYAEIELSHLIGATNAFIRRPFLYAGAIYGLLGGLLAILITICAIALFNESIQPLAAEYQTQFTLRYPSLNTGLVTSLLAILIGVISAFTATSKYILKSIR